MGLATMQKKCIILHLASQIIIGMVKNRRLMVLRKEQAELFHMQRINSGLLLFIAEGYLTID